jgi:hypothetical protein
MTTVAVFMPELRGATGLTLYLRKSSDYSLVNAGGDPLTESGTSGWFTCDVAEAWTETLSVTIVDSNSLVPRSGWLVVGSVIVSEVLDPTIAAQLDDLEDSITSYISGMSAVVSTSMGTIIGFPTSLNIGDSYTTEADSDIRVFIRDAEDNPITSVGDYEFTDPEFEPEVIITQSGSTGRVKAIVTYVDPGAAESYLTVEIPSSQSRRASPGTATVQCILRWVDSNGFVLCQKTLSQQAITWNEMV